MNLKYCLFALIVISYFHTLAQQPLIFDSYKSLDGNEPIDVDGEQLHFRMKNVCYDDLIFGIPQTDSSGAKLIMLPYKVDTSIGSEMITGISGNIGNNSSLFFSGTDTLYYRAYKASGFVYNRLSTNKMFVPNIIKLIGNPDYLWLMQGDTSGYRLISVTNAGIGFTLADTVSLPEMDYFNDGSNIGTSNPFLANMAGKDSLENWHYLQFNTVDGNINRQYDLGEISGDLLYVDADEDKAIFCFDDSSKLKILQLDFANQDTAHFNLGTYDSIIGVSGNMYENEIMVLVSVSGQYKALVYNVSSYNQVRQYTLPVTPIKYFSNSGILSESNSFNDYLIYTDSSGQKYLSPIEGNFTGLQSNFFKIEQSPSTYYSAFVCFVGIDEKKLPEVKTYLYPNPASEQLTVLVKNVPCEMQHSLELFDLQGKRVFSTFFESKCTVTVPMEGLQPAMYLVKMQINGKTYTRKVMKK